MELSALQITSCTPFTGSYGCYVWDGGWIEGAFVHLSTVAGLASSFYTSFVQCLTEETAPTEKVANIIGVPAGLIGGQRALVCGHVYVGKDCDLALRGLAPRLMELIFGALCTGAGNSEGRVHRDTALRIWCIHSPTRRVCSSV